MSSLLLTTPNDPLLSPGWDLTLDEAGNIALADANLSIAQDVACVCRAFQGEVWYNTNEGLPYFQQILGFVPSLQFLKSQYVAAALSVPGVASAVCFLTGPGKSRQVGGQIQITSNSGVVIGSIETSALQGELPWYINAAVDGAFVS